MKKNKEFQSEEHEVLSIRLKRLGKTQQWLADKIGTNRMYVSLCLSGKHPGLLPKIKRVIEKSQF